MSTSMTTSLSPIAPARFGLAEARHLLRRTAFGASPAEVAEVAALGPERAVDRLVDYHAIPAGGLPEPDVDPDVLRSPTEEERRAFRAARQRSDQAALDRFRQQFLERQAQDRRMFHGLVQWWVQRILETPRPLEENLTLLWHSHFATRYRSVRDAYLMYRQNAFLRRYACDRFARLAAGIVRDPAMIRFLNNDRNNRRQPNENLARELMELFTLGEGNYTERDIKEAARALTGYHVDDNDFVFRESAHDGGSKTILGQRGDFDGDDVVRILLRRDDCPRYIAFKLYRHFVADVPEDLAQTPIEQQRVIEALAQQLRRQDYAIAPVLKLLLRSEHFYDPAIIGQKIKSPIEVLAGTVRTLGTPARESRVLLEALRAMGQVPFEPPSVAGWDVGRAWVNTSTLFVRQNLCTYLITGKMPGRGGWDRGDVAYDPTRLMANLTVRTPEAVVDFFVDALLGEHIPPARRQPLVQFMRQRDKGVTRDSVVALLLLITAMPEYQLC